MKKKTAGFVAGGALATILIIALFLVLGTAFTAFLVWLVWNVIIHAAFGVSILTFWQVVAVAFGINIVLGLMRSGG